MTPWLMHQDSQCSRQGPTDRQAVHRLLMRVQPRFRLLDLLLCVTVPVLAAGDETLEMPQLTAELLAKRASEQAVDSSTASAPPADGQQAAQSAAGQWPCCLTGSSMGHLVSSHSVT